MRRKSWQTYSLRRVSRLMISTYDVMRLSRLEDSWLEPDEADDSDEYENDMWLRADDECEERFCENLMERRE